MDGVALKMLFGDRAKYIGLTFGIAFSTMLMSNQVSIFTGLMLRTASQILDAREADISNYVLDNGNQMSESASGQAGAIISPGLIGRLNVFLWIGWTVIRKGLRLAA